MNGLGGIGKTVVAQEYANRFRADYHWVAWVFVQSGLRSDLVSLGQKYLGLEFAQYTPLAEQFEQVMVALRKVGGHNLLIVDNANDAGELVDLQVDLQTSGWQVLITSRCEPDDYLVMPVDELAEADAVELFRHHFSDSNGFCG